VAIAYSGRLGLLFLAAASLLAFFKIDGARCGSQGQGRHEQDGTDAAVRRSDFVRSDR
jgi:hypothetical protein